MTDETEKPMTVTEFVEKHRELKFAKGGRLYFDHALLPGDDEINLMRPRKSSFPATAEYIVPNDHPLARMHRVGSETGRFSGRSFVMQVKLTDKMTPEVKKFRDQLRFYQLRAYYGERIAFLLTSKDRRQRKRGARLRDKKMIWGLNLTELEARVMVPNFRESMEGAKLAAFWNTELGEPYDPERYRKD